MRQFIRKNIWAVAPVVFVLVALVALAGSPLSSSKVQETPAEDDNLIVVRCFPGGKRICMAKCPHSVHSGRFHQGKRLHADF